jgi:hypothetical protein
MNSVESDPPGGVHVEVMLVSDVFLIDIVRFDTFCAKFFKRVL